MGSVEMIADTTGEQIRKVLRKDVAVACIQLITGSLPFTRVKHF